MELLVADLGPRFLPSLQTTNGDFLDYSRSTRAGDIDEPHVAAQPFHGTLAPEYTPDSVRFCNFKTARVTDSIATARLSESLERINLYQNALEGTVDFAAFPPKLKYAVIARNRLYGSAALTSPPKGLILLDVSRNAFRGGIDLKHTIFHKQL